MPALCCRHRLSRSTSKEPSAPSPESFPVRPAVMPVEPPPVHPEIPRPMRDQPSRHPDIPGVIPAPVSRDPGITGTCNDHFVPRRRRPDAQSHPDPCVCCRRKREERGECQCREPEPFSIHCVPLSDSAVFRFIDNPASHNQRARREGRRDCISLSFS